MERQLLLPETSATFAEMLTTRLLSLSFEELERCVCTLLKAMGYQEPKIISRRHRKGRHANSGVDVAASLAVGVTRVPVFALLKQFRRPVQRRFIDELRGSMLRKGVGRGLVITTSTFPAGTRSAATSVRDTPIDLIDGRTLCALLIRYRIGVIEQWNPTLMIDEAFFAGLACPDTTAI